MHTQSYNVLTVISSSPYSRIGKEKDDNLIHGMSLGGYASSVFELPFYEKGKYIPLLLNLPQKVIYTY